VEFLFLNIYFIYLNNINPPLFDIYVFEFTWIELFVEQFVAVAF